MQLQWWNLSVGANGLATLTKLGAVATSVIIVALLLFSMPRYPSPFILIAFAAVPIAVVIAFARPFFICLLFIAFSVFRIPEIFPVLELFHIPKLLAGLLLLTFAWHLAVTRSITPYLTPDLTLFLMFFALVTIGLFFAIDQSLALHKWTDEFWKIGLITLVIAWLARTREDFASVARLVIIIGLLLAVVTIGKKVAGIDLVEGSRAKIGTASLGDPNDLALLLLIPLSFSAAVLVYRETAFDTCLALLTTPIFIGAIIATQSRGGLLGLLAVIGIIALRCIKSKTILVILIPAVAVGVFFAAGISERSSGGAQEIARLGVDESSRGRLDAWIAAVDVATARPLTGVGLGNFSNNYFAFTWDGERIQTHSIWFEVLSEVGFLGLVVYSALIIVCWIKITSSIRILNDRGAAASTRATALALQSALFSFCVAGSFLTQAFAWPFYLLLALISAVGHYAANLSQAPES